MFEGLDQPNYNSEAASMQVLCLACVLAVCRCISTIEALCTYVALDG